MGETAMATNGKATGEGADETGLASSVAVVPANEVAIRDLIYTVRGAQVMPDSDIAMLYQVETKRVNEAVRRNKARFPKSSASGYPRRRRAI